MRLNRTTVILSLLFSASIAIGKMNCVNRPRQFSQMDLPLIRTVPAPFQNSYSTSPVYTVVDDEPQPAAGKSNAKGTVLWAGKGVNRAEVLLCDPNKLPGVFMVGNPDICGAKQIKTRTDSNGNYQFTNVPAGLYSIVIKTLESKNMYFELTEKSSAYGLPERSKIKLEEGKTTKIQTQSVWRTDIKLISPKSGQTLRERQPVLGWEAYPEAVRYTMSLKSGGKEVGIMEQGDNQYVPGGSLSDGLYYWEVEAFGENGEVIAKSRSEFRVGPIPKSKPPVGYGTGTGDTGK